ncbi:MAG TPA: hypothetical protein V6C82_04310 [Chroococcales cyanobacterium]|jgi:hypothetical protein
MERNAIACEALDKDNQAWAKKYLTRLDDLLQGELAKQAPDSCYCRFLEGEVLAYRELLGRFN